MTTTNETTEYGFHHVTVQTALEIGEYVNEKNVQGLPFDLIELKVEQKWAGYDEQEIRDTLHSIKAELEETYS